MHMNERIFQLKRDLEYQRWETDVAVGTRYLNEICDHCLTVSYKFKADIFFTRFFSEKDNSCPSKKKWNQSVLKND